jgi:hypothetical protein
VNSSKTPTSSSQFNWLKVIGALTVLWLAAKIIGTLLSPGVIALAIVVWLIVRSQRNKANKPVAQFVPMGAPVYQAGVGAPAMWSPAPAGFPVSSAPAAHSQFGLVPFGVGPVPFSSNMAPQTTTTMTPTITPTMAPTVTLPLPARPVPAVGAPVFDERSAAEREIEEFVQRSWPNV